MAEFRESFDNLKNHYRLENEKIQYQHIQQVSSLESQIQHITVRPICLLLNCGLMARAQSGYEDALANLNTRELPKPSNSLMSPKPRDPPPAIPILMRLEDETPDGGVPTGDAKPSDEMETEGPASPQARSQEREPPTRLSTNSKEVPSGEQIRHFIRLGKRPKARKISMEAWVSEPQRCKLDNSLTQARNFPPP